MDVLVAVDDLEALGDVGGDVEEEGQRQTVFVGALLVQHVVEKGSVLGWRDYPHRRHRVRCSW